MMRCGAKTVQMRFFSDSHHKEADGSAALRLDVWSVRVCVAVCVCVCACYVFVYLCVFGFVL